jgi:hypothetical protein
MDAFKACRRGARRMQRTTGRKGSSWVISENEMKRACFAVLQAMITNDRGAGAGAEGRGLQKGLG